MKFVTTETVDRLISLRVSTEGVDIICGPYVVASFKSDLDTFFIDENALKKVGVAGRVRLVSEKGDDFTFAAKGDKNADHA